jgi:hypothetical protein
VQSTTSSRIVVAGSIASVALVATVASVPRSPFQPVLPAGADPQGPFRWLAGVTGLDRVHGNPLVAVALLVSVLATVAFLAILWEAWRGTVSPRLVIAMAVAFHVVVLFLPLLFSRDVYSYAYYGRIASTYHANPYVATPSDFPRDALAAYVGPRWVRTPAVYGPLFTLASSFVVRLATTLTGMILAFRLAAVAASLGTIAIVANLVRRVRPGREAFAVAIVGLNPVVLFQSVASGHNDLWVALAIAGAMALVFSGRDLLATAVLTLGALVKAPAAVPLLLLIAAAVARREPGRRGRTVLAHLGVVAALVLVFAAPFFQTSDPSLGMVELAHHQGWLAPSRFFARVLDALTHERLGVVSRISFAAMLVAALVLVGLSLLRRAPSIPPEADGAAWGWALLFLMLLGPVLLPWYVTWALPVAWLLPRVPRLTLILTVSTLSVSQWVTEPSRYPHPYNANVLFGHYVLSPVAVGLLVWLAVDFLRRVRTGTPLEQEQREVPATAGKD